MKYFATAGGLLIVQGTRPSPYSHQEAITIAGRGTPPESPPCRYASCGASAGQAIETGVDTIERTVAFDAELRYLVTEGDA